MLHVALPFMERKNIRTAGGPGQTSRSGSGRSRYLQPLYRVFYWVLLAPLSSLLLALSEIESLHFEVWAGAGEVGAELGPGTPNGPRVYTL